MKQIFFCALLIFVITTTPTLAEYTNGMDAGIDAGPIGQWKETWCASAIETSLSNASESGITLTFNIRVTNSVPDGGIVEIYFPASFTNVPDPFPYTLTSGANSGQEI